MEGRCNTDHQGNLRILSLNISANLRQLNERFLNTAIQISAIMALAGRNDEVQFSHARIQSPPGCLDIGDQRTVDHAWMVRESSHHLSRISQLRDNFGVHKRSDLNSSNTRSHKSLDHS